ncbi:UDP-N-acetylmuramoyl-L-alanyl-D-glutamate--2,6-diaminopimelate ligase [Paenactinomyces guangxiensis]|uniref:UDP-N-acetylmuramoyl-L-alanyl-D-glutamate--2,6-diaminopimelate ligase n=1 Tax=Paenactinomyces guangxiensis TaxID=1490290 RepID=A0A7W2A781_9BACL|nr:UDP-N-acetylmuramoyl-L-alanyl-D-glutamate--2,6-diaminopimelate ligase [Paenactinomyces guangxiensis]MBA4494251.1 UDP-N-acetylmuramoyl-L-alanyl-D-glutamate--2,6-diaminopimelate ligase [Paenactinomyces guangxiensis]MBH8590747.1 UDP-N-acetylmuramoyl-L-alanyl-D-glutamate--2,6-diaminopimelate ligase [Paenactinomyces guangxiensis]
MFLKDLIRPLVLHKLTGDPHTEIQGIQIDSRQVKPGDLFIALRGFTVDGHRFIAQAVEKGAAAVLAEEPVSPGVPVVQVPDSRRAMAVVASTFYRHPTRELKLIGITGTNGKTTTSHLIHRIFNDVGHKSGLIGTIHMKIGDRTYKVNNTTPEAVDLQKSFRLMRDEGCDYSVIEVSSHALEMGRTRGCRFRTAVFTNLTQDHLDYHETMEEYRAAKGLLFSQLGNNYADLPDENSFAVLNADDDASAYFTRVTPAQVITYGIEKPADVRAENIRVTSAGTAFTLHTYQGSAEIQLRLMGKFNVYNGLAAISSALLEGISLEQIKQSLESISGVNGRFEPVQAGQPFTVIVDYSHTPDSLENALTTIREFAQGRVICVVGCGGDRDRGKRPLMAKIAEKYSDLSVITSDNPRTEDPEAIIADMVEGLKGVAKSRFVTITDRKQAIHYAIGQAEPRDVVLIAGKGHETYQEIHGVRYDFDDREVARTAIFNRQSNEGS